jgi:hypothetical protein
VTSGVEEDELYIRAVGTGRIEILCVHCRAVTAAAAEIGDVVPCTGCVRRLVVYYHVSRRTGQFLGYALDAEEADG